MMNEEGGIKKPRGRRGRKRGTGKRERRKEESKANER
jgi:hypothetical protein